MKCENKRNKSQWGGTGEIRIITSFSREVSFLSAPLRMTVSLLFSLARFWSTLALERKRKSLFSTASSEVASASFNKSSTCSSNFRVAFLQPFACFFNFLSLLKLLFLSFMALFSLKCIWYFCVNFYRTGVSLWWWNFPVRQLLTWSLIRRFAINKVAWMFVSDTCWLRILAQL